MATGLADYGANTFTDWITGVSSPPSLFWVALCLSQPDAAFDGTVLATIEPSGGSYARRSINRGGAYWTPGDEGSVSLAALTFPTATADWGIITHYVFVTAATAGQVYGWGELDEPREVLNGAQIALPIGGVGIQLLSPSNPVVL